MIGWFFLSCFDNNSEDLLSVWPSDPYELVERCDKENIVEMQIICRVQAAADFGKINKEKRGDETCNKVKPKIWNEECHFRLGEELASYGNLMAGFSHCSRSGFYAKNCFKHISQNWRHSFTLDKTNLNSIEDLQDIHTNLIEKAQKNIFDIPEELERSILQNLTAQFGTYIYLGNGSLEISPINITGFLGAALRTGYAMEAARLLNKSRKASVENIIEVWKNPTTVKVPLRDKSSLHGRYQSGLISPYEYKLPKIELYRGGTRLISETPEEDITIAALEAMYWLENTPSESFIPWLKSESLTIRLTAAKLLRFSMTPEIENSEQFLQIKEAADSNVKWYFTQTMSGKKRRRKK